MNLYSTIYHSLMSPPWQCNVVLNLQSVFHKFLIYKINCMKSRRTFWITRQIVITFISSGIFDIFNLWLFITSLQCHLYPLLIVERTAFASGEYESKISTTSSMLKIMSRESELYLVAHWMDLMTLLCQFWWNERVIVLNLMSRFTDDNEEFFENQIFTLRTNHFQYMESPISGWFGV